MSSRTAFTLFEQTYASDSTPNSEYSLARVSSNLLQLLGLMALLQTSSNAFPRSLHGDCLFLPTASERQCSGRGTIPHASLKYSGFRFRFSIHYSPRFNVLPTIVLPICIVLSCGSMGGSFGENRNDRYTQRSSHVTIHSNTSFPIHSCPSSPPRGRFIEQRDPLFSTHTHREW